jgi:hypothetical protein
MASDAPRGGGDQVAFGLYDLVIDSMRLDRNECTVRGHPSVAL